MQKYTKKVVMQKKSRIFCITTWSFQIFLGFHKSLDYAQPPIYRLAFPLKLFLANADSQF